MMTNRRQSHFGRRRTHHMIMRITKVMRQQTESGTIDSGKAQKAQTALKSRKA